MGEPLRGGKSSAPHHASQTSDNGQNRPRSPKSHASQTSDNGENGQIGLRRSKRRKTLAQDSFNIAADKKKVCNPSLSKKKKLSCVSKLQDPSKTCAPAILKGKRTHRKKTPCIPKSGKPSNKGQSKLKHLFKWSVVTPPDTVSPSNASNLKIMLKKIPKTPKKDLKDIALLNKIAKPKKSGKKTKSVIHIKPTKRPLENHGNLSKKPEVVLIGRSQPFQNIVLHQMH